MEKPIATPVLFLIFNRPDKTRTVFDRIRQARPTALYIAADGPRPNRPGEAELCAQTRQIVLDGIDWPCKIKTLFRDKNLSCKLAPSSAITWFFEQVVEGIILEDDCLPDFSFFRFCEELLEYYRNTEQVMMISGDNFQPVKRGTGSYFFSRYGSLWGWATWRRAWKKYDVAMRKWPKFRDSRELFGFMKQSTARRTEKMFAANFNGKTNTWERPWLFACWAHHGLSIMPAINLVTNIDSGGTHMKVYEPCIHLAAKTMPFPLQHPETIQPDAAADQYTERYIFLRSWIRTIFLIARYLWRILRQTPLRLPSAIKLVCVNLLTEMSTRRRLQNDLTQPPPSS